MTSNDLITKPHHDRNALATRNRILDGARQAFAHKGYGDVGVREIAAIANCDPALIRRYFGSKEALFEEALSQALDVSRLIDGPIEGFGARAVDHFLHGDHNNGYPMIVLIFSTADPTSRTIALRLLEERVIKPIAAWLGREDGAELAGRISILCSGYFLYYRILPLKALSTPSPDRTHDWLARQLQAIVDEPRPTDLALQRH